MAKSAWPAWIEARRAEVAYSARLRGMAKQIGQIVKGFAPDGVVKDMDKLLTTLSAYSTMMTPWAEAVANYMVADVERRNERLWRKVASEMGSAIRIELSSSRNGIVYRQMMDEQVELIKSLPTKAGERVHYLTTEALATGRRAESIAQEIKETQHVTESRARLIARTEVARTAATFMQSRAMAAGSDSYIWRTVRDADVRETHKEMEGRVIRWDNPPKTDKNLAPYHAGCGPNCRCYAEPILPDL